MASLTDAGKKSRAKAEDWERGLGIGVMEVTELMESNKIYKAPAPTVLGAAEGEQELYLAPLRMITAK